MRQGNGPLFFPIPPPSVVFLTWPGRAELRGFIVLWWVQRKEHREKNSNHAYRFFPSILSLPPYSFSLKRICWRYHATLSRVWSGVVSYRVAASRFRLCEKKRRNFAGELEREEAVDNSCYRKSLRAMLEVIGWALLYKKGVKKGSITVFFYFLLKPFKVERWMALMREMLFFFFLVFILIKLFIWNQFKYLRCTEMRNQFKSR